MNINVIRQLFEKHANPDKALEMAAYMKNICPFLGLPKPIRSALQKEFLHSLCQINIIDWSLVNTLWDMPEREFHYLALDYLIKLKKHLNIDDFLQIENLITQKSWWDTVDIIATNLVGELCYNFPQITIASWLTNWRSADNLWLRRSAILFQLKYKDKTDIELLSTIINANLGSKEFFINKAIGWILREYSKTNKPWVQQFVQQTALAPLTLREASKYL